MTTYQQKQPPGRIALSKFIPLLLAVSCVLWPFSILAESGRLQVTHSDNARFYFGDEPNWLQPDIQSDQWGEFDRLTRARTERGLFWMAFDVHLDVQQPAQFDFEYHIHMLAAQEVYWDGVLLGTNGVPAASMHDEQPGYVWTTYLIPKELLTQGKHVIKIRGSDHHRLSGMKFLREGWIAPYDPQFRYVDIWSLIPSLLVSIGAVIGIYFLMLYFTEGRQMEHLVFFVLLEALTALGYAIQWDHLVGYTYDWEPYNLAIEYLSIMLVLVLLPLYFLLKHKVAKPWLWLLITIFITAVLAEVFPDINVMAWYGSFTLALVVSVYFGIRSKRFLWWESLGLVLCIVGLSTQDFEEVFIYFPTLFAFILLTHAVSMQKRKQALTEANLLETQLRAELLRKHIQPHFLLNTLTSLMEWVETDVERSTEFIAELAEEFRLMSQVSSKPVIDLSLELQLCNKHLAIMALRLQKQCVLETKGLDGNERLPPAIFHTLLENAFSHNVYQQSDLQFSLVKTELEDGFTQFVFSAPTSQQSSSQFAKLGTGTGKKYIETRLNQTFGEFWSMNEQELESNWITEIRVKMNKMRQSKLTEAEL